MLLTKENPTKFVIPPVQEQIGQNYYDLFALALATPLCHGVPPEERDYDQGLMRWHLHWIFGTAGSAELSRLPKLAKTFLVRQWRKVASGTAALVRDVTQVEMRTTNINLFLVFIAQRKRTVTKYLVFVKLTW